MSKQKTLIGVLVVAAIAIGVYVVSSQSGSGFAGGDNKSIEAMLDSTEFGGDEAGFLDQLTDEQLAELDIAYDSSVKDGSKKSKEEWLKTEVHAHFDNNGDMVVVLPDGGEFTVPMKKAATKTNERGTSNKDTSSSQNANSGTNDASTDDTSADKPQNDESADKGTSADDSSKAEEGTPEVKKKEKDKNEKTKEETSKDEESKGGKDKDTKVEDDRKDASSEDKSKDDSKDDKQKDDSKQEDPPKSESRITATPVVSVATVQAKQNDKQVAVPVSIENNPGILGLTLSISYDESALTLTSAENGPAFRDVLTMTRSRGYGSGCQFSWDGVELSSEDVNDGVILTLYFDVAKDASGSCSVVARSSNSAFDASLNEITFVTEDGRIVVQ